MYTVSQIVGPSDMLAVTNIIKKQIEGADGGILMNMQFQPFNI